MQDGCSAVMAVLGVFVGIGWLMSWVGGPEGYEPPPPARVTKPQAVRAVDPAPEIPTEEDRERARLRKAETTAREYWRSLHPAGNWNWDTTQSLDSGAGKIVVKFEYSEKNVYGVREQWAFWCWTDTAGSEVLDYEDKFLYVRSD